MSSLETIPRMSEVAGTLGNESRLILLQLIAAGETSVEALARQSGLPIASASQHLQVLKKANMVAARREGKRILYRLEPGPIRELVDALERFAVFSAVQAAAGLDPSAPKGALTARALRKKLKNGEAYLVDVRSREEYRKGHIPEAVNIPYDELASHKFPKHKETVVYCRGPLCVLSVHAAALLQARGVKATRLETGFAGWSAEPAAR